MPPTMPPKEARRHATHSLSPPSTLAPHSAESSKQCSRREQLNPDKLSNWPQDDENAIYRMEALIVALSGFEALRQQYRDQRRLIETLTNEIQELRNARRAINVDAIHAQITKLETRQHTLLTEINDLAACEGIHFRPDEFHEAFQNQAPREEHLERALGFLTALTACNHLPTAPILAAGFFGPTTATATASPASPDSDPAAALKAMRLSHSEDPTDAPHPPVSAASLEEDVLPAACAPSTPAVAVLRVHRELEALFEAIPAQETRDAVLEELRALFRARMGASLPGEVAFASSAACLRVLVASNEDPQGGAELMKHARPVSLAAFVAEMPRTAGVLARLLRDNLSERLLAPVSSLAPPSGFAAPEEGGAAKNAAGTAGAAKTAVPSGAASPFLAAESPAALFEDGTLLEFGREELVWHNQHLRGTPGFVHNIDEWVLDLVVREAPRLAAAPRSTDDLLIYTVPPPLRFAKNTPPVTTVTPAVTTPNPRRCTSSETTDSLVEEPPSPPSRFGGSAASESGSEEAQPIGQIHVSQAFARLRRLCELARASPSKRRARAFTALRELVGAFFLLPGMSSLTEGTAAVTEEVSTAMCFLYYADVTALLATYPEGLAFEAVWGALAGALEEHQESLARLCIERAAQIGFEAAQRLHGTSLDAKAVLRELQLDFQTAVERHVGEACQRAMSVQFYETLYSNLTDAYLFAGPAPPSDEAADVIRFALDMSYGLDIEEMPAAALLNAYLRGLMTEAH